jgi:hypothetical protein
MEASYETVVDPATIVYTLVAYSVHGLFAGAQAVVALSLLGTAVAGLVRRTRGGTAVALRGLVGVGLLLPLVTGAPLAVSAVALVVAVVLFWRAEPGPLRVAALAASALLFAFMLWEREDPMALGVELVWKMNAWRSDELGWQLAADREAPKVGELAPDFSLEDPSGRTEVRLSDFRGKRPVALMFGSYT